MNQNSVSSNLFASKYTNQPFSTNLIQTCQDKFTLVKDINNRPMRKYNLKKQLLSKYFYIYQWRKKAYGPIPKIIIKQNNSSSKQQQIIVYCDHIVKYLSQIQYLTIEESINYLKNMIFAYQQILLKLGYVCIKDQYIGINYQGQIIVWVSSNLAINQGFTSKLKNQYQIIARSISIAYEKCKQKQHQFYHQINFIEPKFQNIKAFIMNFEQNMKRRTLHKYNSSLGDIKSINPPHQNQITQQKNVNNVLTSIKSSNQMSNKSKQFARETKIRNTSIMNNLQNQKSLINNPQLMSPTSQIMSSTTQSQFIDSKNNLKINFSYSHKRKEVSTPKNLMFPRQYTSQNYIKLLGKSNEPNKIQQFTLDGKKSNIQNQLCKEKFQKTSRKEQRKKNYKIVRQYSLYYLPSANLFIIKERKDLQWSYKQKQQLAFGSKASMTCNSYNKTSMTTNSQTQINSRISNSLMKNSSDSDQIIPRILNMSTSNNSSLNKNSGHSNFYSYIHESHNDDKKSRKKQNQYMNTYTFGGLITVYQEDQNKKSPKSCSQQSCQNNEDKLIKKNSNKSIQQLYNHLYFNEQQKKSMIVQESPVYQKRTHQQFQTYNNYKQRPSNNKQFGSLNGENKFNMDAWKNIKGLLNQSRTDLKQSIHCGPEIRTPVNIKLQMLGKFGRDIGQSVIPSNHH